MNGNNLIPVAVAFVTRENKLKSVRETETYFFPQVPREREAVKIGDRVYLVDSVIYYTGPLMNFRDDPRVSLLVIQK